MEALGGQAPPCVVECEVSPALGELRQVWSQGQGQGWAVGSKHQTLHVIGDTGGLPNPTL